MPRGFIERASMKVVDAMFFFQQKEGKTVEESQVAPQAEPRVRCPPAQVGQRPRPKSPGPGDSIAGRCCGVLHYRDAPIGARGIWDSPDLAEIGVQRVDFKRRGQDREEGFPVGGQGHCGL
ncbi:MAG TPA: hypothetical protein DIW61_08865 [Candidatus Aminicenantes bacterium]|nr:hypothetical protein [Candidatus Aminicenantes bacterium]